MKHLDKDFFLWFFVCVLLFFGCRLTKKLVFTQIMKDMLESRDRKFCAGRKKTFFFLKNNNNKMKKVLCPRLTEIDSLVCLEVCFDAEFIFLHFCFAPSSSSLSMHVDPISLLYGVHVRLACI